MFNHFTFADGSNPYITRTNKAFFEMLCKHIVEQTSEHGFTVIGDMPAFKHTYKDCKYILENFAISWQHDFERFNYSYSDISEWQDFFTEYGKRYGLLTVFHENAIC